MNEENKKIRIESDGKFTKVYTPNGDLIPCLSVKFEHTGTFPTATLEIFDFEMDVEVEEDAVEFVERKLTEMDKERE